MPKAAQQVKSNQATLDWLRPQLTELRELSIIAVAHLDQVIAEIGTSQFDGKLLAKLLIDSHKAAVRVREHAKHVDDVIAARGFRRAARRRAGDSLKSA